MKLFHNLLIFIMFLTAYLISCYYHSTYAITILAYVMLFNTFIDVLKAHTDERLIDIQKNYIIAQQHHIASQSRYIEYLREELELRK